ncbi:MAG: Re/Si-specific NAD(P)(+) transhydrogenase subunit alpha [Candidatus Solibacter usitatus]|nr:Re/Si-specific NAD(P)(+) transhydrogenase subunit alpha [Candidatus Solibacter usitatus]
MKIGIIRETFPGERRVAMAPKAMDVLAKSGVEFLVEASAGLQAGFRDEEYRGKGARIEPERAAVIEAADVILQVRTLGANPVEGRADLSLLRQGQVLIGFCEALTAPRACADLAARGLTTFAMELMPRITRAQSMDALSSMATVAGYRAVLLAAEALPRLFPMLMTAAGTIAPARVFVLGAGVAGLQAIATARRLGAVVSGYDLRPAVREQVESLGAKFVQLSVDGAGAEDQGGYAKAMGEDFYRRQRDLIAAVAREQDVIITTAAVPGQKAPVLITAEMVRSMAPGSVVVDLAAERGGNCELTRAGETVVDCGVTVLGPLNLASAAPYHASQMYARNIATFLKHLIQNGNLAVNFDDEITLETLVTYGGEVLHPRVRQAMGLGPAAVAELVGKGV